LVNLYNYSFNDPLNHTDYSGYVPKDKWYGYDKKGPGFKSWYHEQKKNKVYPPNASEEELEDAFEDWVREGRRNPKEKKWKKSKNDENSCNENTETNADSPIPENPESVNSPGDAQARAAVKAAAATAAIAAAGITAAEVGQIILDTLLVLGMFSGG